MLARLRTESDCWPFGGKLLCCCISGGKERDLLPIHCLLGVRVRNTQSLVHTHARAHTPTQSSPGDWRGEDNHRLVQCQTGAPSPTEANMPTCPNVKCQFASVCYSEPFVRLRRMNDETTDYLKNRLTARLMGRKLEVNEWPSSVLQASSFNSLWSNHFS